MMIIGRIVVWERRTQSWEPVDAGTSSTTINNAFHPWHFIKCGNQRV